MGNGSVGVEIAGTDGESIAEVSELRSNSCVDAGGAELVFDRSGGKTGDWRSDTTVDGDWRSDTTVDGDWRSDTMEDGDWRLDTTVAVDCGLDMMATGDCGLDTAVAGDW